MPWRTLTPPPPTVTTPGPVARMSVRRHKNSEARVLLTLNNRLQEQFFGGSVVSKRFRVELGTVADAGQLRLTLDSTGSFEAVKNPHGTARLTLKPWTKNLREPHDSIRVECHWNGQGLDIKLPDWATDQAAKDALAAEFALKGASS